MHIASVKSLADLCKTLVPSNITVSRISPQFDKNKVFIYDSLQRSSAVHTASREV